MKLSRLLVITMLCTVPLLASAVPSSVELDWEAHYQELKRCIQQHANTSQQPVHADLIKTALSQHALVQPSDQTPYDVMLRRGKVLVAHLQSMPNSPDLSAFEDQIAAIENNRKTADQDDYADYKALRMVLRQVAFSNPLLSFDDIVYVERAVVTPGPYNHQVMQYYGIGQEYGGGLYAVKDFKSSQPKVVNLLANAKVESGRLKGKTLLDGAFHSPDLSFDGNKILFAYTEPAKERIEKKDWVNNNLDKWTSENTFHIFKVNADGTGLTQLTDGPYNDVDPIFLPDGRIVFISERFDTRGEGHMFCRCFCWYSPQSTLHSMKADGSDMYPISWFENDEYQPSVMNDGKLVYTRWDYVDRDAAIAQHMWTCYPDGRDPRAPHGNYPHPYSTMPGTGWDGVQVNPLHKKQFHGAYYTHRRPFAEWDIRAIPGSQNVVAVAGPHHGAPYGALITIDTRIEDDGYDSQIKRITPYVAFPEASHGYASPGKRYGTPWPLSETFYLVNYGKGIYLLDAFGNREFIVGLKNKKLRPICPIPLAARDKPPAIPTATYQGERRTPDAPKATISVLDAYTSTLPFPKESKLKELRIIQYIPKSGPYYSSKQIDLGYACQSLSRIVLGTVPIEEDGSVYFEAPIERALSFQVLDEKGMAVQLMRSITYVHPGEQMSCVGCHESKHNAPPIKMGQPMAMKRAPSRIEPEVGGLEPINFHRLVKPVLEKHCVSCHQEKNQNPDMSYQSLEPYAFYVAGGRMRAGGGFGALTLPRHGGSRSIPMKHGAYGARLFRGGYLSPEHHNVDLSPEEKRRITLWLDCNSDEVGVYEHQDKQRQGELVYPSADFDRSNPLGVEFPSTIKVTEQQ